MDEFLKKLYCHLFDSVSYEREFGALRNLFLRKYDLYSQEQYSQTQEGKKPLA